ncbi:zinc dependent phospholipase C family protein [Pontibacter sp. E15-1]|uniref:zinc dependent phospholipase C family protein n=1 Tax=Pontibacter sp. E15-1 TaxID=2919918 RepID=UPI001F4F162D|nr:zinc dependent phospholipase C family protein [Pontibacter sp. E15-1]MCJ8164707.1 zinc dependent phospholipase C family protein [Pontibacter sp. E15-1]
MELKIYKYLACLSLLLCLLAGAAQQAYSYSVLTHQAVVDAAWEEGLKALLLKRYPNATEEELRQAHAYAYGGCIVQDMGYYPFGNTFFTNLTHYVRSGDFVLNLMQASKTVDEYAFSLGALAHFNADIYGHPIGTNRAVPLVYPKTKAAHGDVVTYADDPVAHVKTEFGFDVLQVARGNFAPQSYQDFIGFKVSKDLLKEAFETTYGLELNDVFLNLPLAIGSYRYTIRNVFPELTKAAWMAKKSEIQAAKPGITRRKFVYRMNRAEFHKHWGREYERPGIFARLASWVIRVLPKIGPLRPLAFKPPTPEAEAFFLESFNMTVDNYSAMLKQMRRQDLTLKNLQLDTGLPTAPGEYTLTDETYAELLKKLAKSDFKLLTPELQTDILRFYKKAKPPRSGKDAEDGEKMQEHLAQLKAAQF